MSGGGSVEEAAAVVAPAAAEPEIRCHSDLEQEQLEIELEQWQIKSAPLHQTREVVSADCELVRLSG